MKIIELDFYGIKLIVEYMYIEGRPARITADSYYSTPPEEDEINIYGVFCGVHKIDASINDYSYLYEAIEQQICLQEELF